MEISEYLYLLPMMLAGIMILLYLLRNRVRIKVNAVSFIKKGNALTESCIIRLIRRFVNKDGKIYRFYTSRILKYSQTGVEKFIEIKLVLFLLAFLMAFLVKYTNISIKTEDIFSRFDYHADLLYEYKNVKDVEKAKQQEINYLKKALQEIPKSELVKNAEEVQQEIRSLITQKDSELALPRDTIVNKVYYRLKDYYGVRKLDFPLYLFVALLVSFSPEMLFIIRNIFAEVDARNELRFLKKLMIMNGSIPPVDFMKVLGSLIDHSRYYKKILEDVKENNRKNSIDTKTIYSRYIRDTKDLQVKLFFEKLDEANNYDFRQAIVNIENEFRLEKREVARNIRKRIEIIHVVGVLGFMILITLMTLYLIIPWMEMYNISQIGF